MLLNILLVILVIDCIALTGVILLQRSEGGALGMGGGPTSMFSARGAGDLLSRTTAILATVFFVLSLGITLLAGHSKATSSVTERMKVNPIDLNALSKQQAPPASSAPAQAAPPLPGAAQPAAPPLPGAVQQAQPTQAPRPVARPAQRTAAPPPAPLPTVAPRPMAIPRPNLNAPAAPASGQPGTTP